MLDNIPKYILDKNKSSIDCGSDSLAAEVLTRVKPLVHCFGHIHEANGVTNINGIMFMNSAVCAKNYRATQTCHFFDLPYKNSQEKSSRRKQSL